MASDHPSVHVCKKLPKKGFARKTHRQLKRQLIKLKKREKRRKPGVGKKGKGKGKGKRSGKGKIRKRKKMTRAATLSV